MKTVVHIRAYEVLDAPHDLPFAIAQRDFKAGEILWEDEEVKIVFANDVKIGAILHTRKVTSEE